MKANFKKLLNIPPAVYFAVAFLLTGVLSFFPELWSAYLQIAIWCFMASIYCPYNNFFVKTVFSLVGSMQVYNGLVCLVPQTIPGLHFFLQTLVFLWAIYILVIKYDSPDDRLDNSYFYILRKKDGSFRDFCSSILHPFLNIVIFANGYFYHFENGILRKTNKMDFTQAPGYRDYCIRRGPPLNEGVLSTLDSEVNYRWSWFVFLFRRGHQ